MNSFDRFRIDAQKIKGHAHIFVVFKFIQSHAFSVSLGKMSHDGMFCFHIFGHFNDNPGMYNSAWVTINDVQPGDLLLFPSYIVHSVPPNPSHEDRVTIAFNAVPRYMRAHNYTISMGP